VNPIRVEDGESFIDREPLVKTRVFGFATNASSGRRDPLRRFSSTPFVNDLQLMGRTVRVESNSISFLHLVTKYFHSHQHGTSSEAEFRWRVVCESRGESRPTEIPSSAFSGRLLNYVNIGQKGFLAVDQARRQAIGYLPDTFLSEQTRFGHRPPLDTLLCLTASSLGLVPLSGGCVSIDGRGVMVFGAPNSGKTTTCYLAAKSGLEFQADQMVFLDARQANAWGEGLPAVFRPETLHFLPELQSQVRRSSYEASSFYYFDKSNMQPRQARPISPLCSLFLQRGVNCPTVLREMPREEALSQLRGSVLFEEDQGFEDQLSLALEWLAQMPVYELSYDSDPKIAAHHIEKLMR